MKINTGQIQERQAGIQHGKTVIASNLIHEKEMLDQDGNVIDPRTKQIIKRNDAKNE